MAWDQGFKSTVEVLDWLDTTRSLGAVGQQDILASSARLKHRVDHIFPDEEPDAQGHSSDSSYVEKQAYRTCYPEP